MNDDEEKGYSWETEYERTWEGIREDEHGLVASSVEDIIHKAKRRFVRFLNLNLFVHDEALPKGSRTSSMQP